MSEKPEINRIPPTSSSEIKPDLKFSYNMLSRIFDIIRDAGEAGILAESVMMQVSGRIIALQNFVIKINQELIVANSPLRIADLNKNQRGISFAQHILKLENIRTSQNPPK